MPVLQFDRLPPEIQKVYPEKVREKVKYILATYGKDATEWTYTVTFTSTPQQDVWTKTNGKWDITLKD